MSTDFEHRAKETLSPEFEAIFVYEKYKFYSTKDIVAHPAIVSLPYRYGNIKIFSQAV